MALSTSKFLTWTKGDRKHVSSGMVQIPVEYIEIKGLEYGRHSKGSRKADRKPLPLSFSNLGPNSNAHNDSLTLHEAAVQSATSLIAAMSDMLKSQQFITTPNSGGLYPVQGRPRSRTAPPTPATPLFEESHPVELPGSEPVWRKYSSRAKPQSLEPSYHHSAHKAALAGSISRPHSSPQEPTFRLPVYTKHASSSPSPWLAECRQSLGSTSCASSDDMYRTSTVPGQGKRETKISATKRDISQVAHHKHKHSQSFTGSHWTSRSDRIDAKPSTASQVEYLPDEQLCKNRPGSVFMDPITAMRAAHESHLMALKAAHGQEIASHQAYIALLEQRHISPSINRARSEEPLMIDTYHGCKGAFVTDANANRTESLQSLESLLGDEKRASSEAIAEAETLRRKLSLAHKTQADLGSIRRERDYLRAMSGHSERRVMQLKDIVRKAKESEKSHMSAVASLEASLAAANMQRIDTLEGLDCADQQLRLSRQQEQSLRAQLEELQKHAVTAANSSSEAEVFGGEVFTAPATRNCCTNQVEVPEQILDTPDTSKEARICQLEQHIAKAIDNGQSLRQKLTTALGGADALNAQLSSCYRELKAAESDRDHYNSLLHSELRRQSRLAAQNAHTATPQIQQEAAALLAERISSKQGINAREMSDAETYEQELRHCIEEIIMYKLDVKGYKKDLKVANAKIEYLESGTRPETPDSRTGGSTHIGRPSSNDCDQLREAMPSSGLGILWQQQPSGASSTSTGDSHNSPTPAASMVAFLASPLASPPRRGTPLSVHKKLPKPPPRNPSPRVHTSSPRPPSPPIRRFQIQRAETLRSLSESIISSYAKRGTPEHTGGDMPALPARGRISDPARHETPHLRNATRAPTSKFSSEMLRTPAVVCDAVSPVLKT